MKNKILEITSRGEIVIYRAKNKKYSLRLNWSMRLFG